MRYRFMANKKRPKKPPKNPTTNIDKDVEKMEPAYIAGGNVN